MQTDSDIVRWSSERGREKEREIRPKRNAVDTRGERKAAGLLSLARMQERENRRQTI